MNQIKIVLFNSEAIKLDELLFYDFFLTAAFRAEKNAAIFRIGTLPIIFNTFFFL